MDSSSTYQNGSSNDAEFQRLSHTIATSIQKIFQNVTSMQRMVHQLGTPQETQQLNNQLQELQHYTNQLVKDTAANLQDLQNLPNPLIQSDVRQRKLKREKLTDEFTDALNQFQHAQRGAVQREKEKLQRARAISGNSGLDPPPSSGNNLIELQDNRQIQVYLDDVMNVQELEEQERGIRQLESDVVAVNQIFKQLGQIVHDQGEVVDSIEAHVDEASSQVSHGFEQLRMASQFQNKARRKKFCLWMTAIIIVIVLILILVLSLKN